MSQLGKQILPLLQGVNWQSVAGLIFYLILVLALLTFLFMTVKRP